MLLAPDGPGKGLLDVWPDAMLRLFLANRRRLLGEASPGMVSTSLDAFTRVVLLRAGEIDEAAFARACALTTDEPACGPALSSQSQSVLRECALEPELRVRWDDDGQAVPNDWGSRGRWSQMYAPRARDALLATELFTIGTPSQGRPVRTNAEHEELFAEALEFFSGCSWFLASDQLHNSMHCVRTSTRVHSVCPPPNHHAACRLTCSLSRADAEHPEPRARDPDERARAQPREGFRLLGPRDGGLKAV